MEFISAHRQLNYVLYPSTCYQEVLTVVEGEKAMILCFHFYKQNFQSDTLYNETCMTSIKSHGLWHATSFSQ